MRSLTARSPARRSNAHASRAAARLHDDLGDPATGAAWSIISYILSGILFWGGLGWLLDRWLIDPTGDTKLFTPIGVIVGTAAGAYLGYMRYLQVTRPQMTQAVREP
jgi:F0F1-type ATP synthase assembly protein I